MATQFACSGRFASQVSREPAAWEAPDANNRIDAWLTARAMAAPARVGQVWAPGATEPPHAKRPPVREVFQQVVGALFSVMCDDVETWREVRGSIAVPTLGGIEAARSERPAFDVSSFVSTFANAVRDLRPVLEPAVGADTFEELAEAAAARPPRLGEEIWAKTVCRAIAATARRALPASQIVAAIFPLYLGRVATFFEETRALGVEEANAKNEALSLAFEQAKVELAERLRAVR